MTLTLKQQSDWLTVDATDALATNRRVPAIGGAGATIGSGIPILAASPGTYTATTRFVVKAASTGGCVFAAGDLWVATGGTGFTLGVPYVVQSYPNANTVKLAAQASQNYPLPAADNADTSGYLIPFTSLMRLAVNPCRLTSILVTTLPTADKSIEIRDFRTGNIMLSITIPLLSTVPRTINLGRKNGGVTFPDGFSIDAQSGSATLAYNLYFSK